MFAIVVFENGQKIKMKAEKKLNHWLIGGEHAKATFDCGAKIFIVSDKKVYSLKGCRMVFEDNYIAQEWA